MEFLDKEPEAGMMSNDWTSRFALDRPVPMAGPTTQDHYAKLRPEPIDVIEGWGLDYLIGNAVKYIGRAGKK